MKAALTVVAIVFVVVSAAQAEPVRSAEGWAIYAQPDAASWQAIAAGENLALGKPVAARPTPNYQHSGDKIASLTDGVLAGGQGRMWTDARAVGWAYQDYAQIVVDLGERRPVGRVIARFQAIPKDNYIPRVFNLSLSTDGEYYHPARTLIEKVNPEDNPAHTFDPIPNETAMIYAVVLEAGYEARYVRLDLTAHGLIVCDEVAVLAAEGEARELPPAPPGAGEYLDNTFDRRDQFARALAPGNLVAGKALRYAPQPAYRLTTNPTDATDLTDGKLAERADERIWFESGAVCWQMSPQVTIFADLGESQPIGQVVARFLGGAEQGSLTFPDEIRVLASNDGEEYYLVTARHKAGLDDASSDAYHLPETGQAWVQNFILPVGVKARYLAVQVDHHQQFICSDEIAVVRGRDSLPALVPQPNRRVQIVTSGVCFNAIRATLPVCVTMPLRTKLAVTDARSGKDFKSPCKLILDLPSEVEMVTPGYAAEAVEHDGRQYKRYTIKCNRGEVDDFYLQTRAEETKGSFLYMYGDSGNGPENERRVAWKPIEIPPVRVPKRLHVSLSWGSLEGMSAVWPNFLANHARLGFNAVACFPRYWKEADVPARQQLIAEAREAGFKIICNESPSAALSEDRNEAETKSQFATGPGQNFCIAYRGQYWQKQIARFARHAVWIKPDYIFYDIEAFWGGAVDAPRCTRCQERYQAGGFRSWDEFRAAMGKEMHVQMKAAVEKALAEAGVTLSPVYVSYRTDAITKLNDGIFNWADLYPDLLQLAQPSLYVAGDRMKVARSIAGNRALLPANDILPMMSTGCYGEYEPSRTRDQALEVFANGGQGVTYYWYGDFDPEHFMYLAEAVDIVAPIEDIFMDGRPIAGLKADKAKVKVCGMELGDDRAVLVSNYEELPPATKVRVTTPAQAGTPVWDLHTGQKIGEVKAGGVMEITLGTAEAHMYYLGSTYGAAVTARP